MSCLGLHQEEWDVRDAEDDSQEMGMKCLPIAKRLGFVSKSRLASQAGDIRLNWKKKLVKPRMGMVADLEEESCGKKTSVLTICRNPSNSENFFSDFSRRPIEPLTPTQIIEQDEDSGSPEISNRAFHFVKESLIECNDSLEADCGQDLERSNSNIIIKISREEEEDGSEPESINNNDQEKMVFENKEDPVELNVINKIAAIKEIDRKLLTMEEKRRKYNEGYGRHRRKVRSPEISSTRKKVPNPRRRRKRERSSSSSSSCSSSSSESDSDSSSDSGSEVARRQVKGGREGGRGEIDLKEKLKHYLNKAKKRRSGKN